MCDVFVWPVSNYAEPAEYDRAAQHGRYLAAFPSRQRENFLMTQTSSEPSARPAKRVTDPSLTGTEQMTTDDGKISVAQSVVQKIAGIACREISGVHAMGVSTSRAYGAVRERIPGSSGPNVAQGVGVEVGETQAAIDQDIVVEVNINVDDLYLPGGDDQDDAPSRVS
jgi:uncharacterized alkaline shock family protein YloU